MKNFIQNFIPLIYISVLLSVELLAKSSVINFEYK